MSYPYFGISAPGAGLFFVDGDFTIADPVGLPEISYPLQGDSILSTRDVALIDTGVLITVPLGTYPNIAPWSANQSAAVLEQEFVVAQSAYIPMRLNTPYDPIWAIGWTNYFVSLDQFYLVHEGELRDIGGGLCTIRRRWATLPPTRSETEQFTYNFIGYGDISGVTRERVPFSVISRLQYDYFIFDDLNVLALPLFAEDGGRRLNATTGLYPPGLLLPALYYFNDAAGITNNIFTDFLNDGDGVSIDPTVPSFTEYTNAITGASTLNGDSAEIVAESSTMTRWMGNIFERRTRFVLAQ
jgi:hypothetical protein